MADKQSRFDIVITATDKATAIIRKVNTSWSKAMDPIVKTGNAFRSLSKEAGFEKTAAAIGKVGRAAQDTAGRISGMIAPIVAVTGLSAAGLVTMTVEWARLGAEVLKTSRIIGLSTTSLQELRGAAQLANVDGGSLTAGMKALGDTMQDAVAGRNQEALMIMGRLGLRMRHTRDGAVDTQRAFMDLAGAISRVKNPQVQGLIARTFGLEEVLPLLQQGKKGIEELRRQMEETGAVMSGPALARATDFKKSMTYLKLSFEGVQNAIADKLIPVVQPMLEQFSRWLQANRAIIATNVTSFVQGFAEAVKSVDWTSVVQGAKDFVGTVQTAVGWMGGWKNVIVGVAAVIGGSLVFSITQLAGAMFGAAGQALLLIGRLGILAGAAIPGLLLQAGLLAEAMGLEGVAGAFVAVGAAIEATPIGWIITGVAGLSYAAYELYENWSTVKKWWRELWGDMSDDADQGTKRVVRSVQSNLPSRSGPLSPQAAAQQSAWDALDASRRGSAPPVRPTGGAPVTPIGGFPGAAGVGAGLGAAAAAVQVTITFENAPARMGVKTNSTGGVIADVRIDRSMPQFVGP